MVAPASKTLGLYLSIPFCRSKCTYCNFASGVFPASDHQRYVERLVQDLSTAGEWAGRTGVDLPQRVDTIYLGGGTPSLLAPELVTRLFGAIRAVFGLEPDAEITVECAPGQITDGTLAALAAAGVNRVSLGVQSFIDREAAVSGRLHTRKAVVEDLRRLRGAGISNISIDLIAGLPEQTLASWEESLAVLVETGVPHASVYMLEVDEESRLGREVLQGGVRYHAGLVPGEDAIVRMYSMAIETLGRAGLAQYEISNFCRQGMASKHNLRYWQRRPYLGVGLDASSMLCGVGAHKGQVLRTTTCSEMKAFFDSGAPEETEWLDADRQHEEAWFLGLRLNSGVAIEVVEREFGRERARLVLPAVERLAREGLLSSDGNIVRLTDRGQLLSNEVFQEFLDLKLEAPSPA